MKSKLVLTIAISVWAIVCGCLTTQLIDFSTKPGLRAVAKVDWPSTSTLTPAADKYTVVAFLHPRCPCSRASIAELSELMENHRDKVKVFALFLKPTQCPEEFVKSDLYKEAACIKGVEPVVDENGQEASLFGSKTSGQLLVYSPGQQLVFAGGITSARGHYGDNVGLDAVQQILSDKKETMHSSDVYGCPLFASNTSILRR